MEKLELLQTITKDYLTNGRSDYHELLENIEMTKKSLDKSLGELLKKGYIIETLNGYIPSKLTYEFIVPLLL
ncbi:MAG: hypothetical protein J7L45_02925 [Candidatus Aenigmarchaeota archaeon]|nr:hypothetical protein [Candidatus Aenigmarchaeota archaeon]